MTKTSITMLVLFSALVLVWFSEINMPVANQLFGKTGALVQVVGILILLMLFGLAFSYLRPKYYKQWFGLIIATLMCCLTAYMVLLGKNETLVIVKQTMPDVHWSITGVLFLMVLLLIVFVIYRLINIAWFKNDQSWGKSTIKPAHKLEQVFNEKIELKDVSRKQYENQIINAYANLVELVREKNPQLKVEVLTPKQMLSFITPLGFYQTQVFDLVTEFESIRFGGLERKMNEKELNIMIEKIMQVKGANELNGEKV